MRLFFALWPPAETAAALHEWANKLDGRPTRAGNIHLTLAFLGEADPAEASAAARRVQGERHELAIERAEYWRHNKIIWVGPAETPDALKTLANQLKVEERPFAAHVTLLRKAPMPASFPELPKVTWPATEFALVVSAGGKYETLERFQLR
jgi:RNA 2',3'-cyclic 3'-phosphodiesterase